MRRLIATTLLSATVLSAAAHAATPANPREPAPIKGGDKLVRSWSYSPARVLRLTSTNLEPVQVILHKGEVAEDIAGVHVWVPPAKDKETAKNAPSAPVDWIGHAEEDAVFFQPLHPMEPSMVFVTTTRLDTKEVNHYLIQLVTADEKDGASEGYSVVRVTYPTEVSAAQRLVAERKVVQRQERLAQDRLRQSTHTDDRNWMYLAQGNDCSVIGPPVENGVWNNGQITSILFTPGTTIPEIWKVNPEGKEEVVQKTPTTTDAGLQFTVNAVAREFVLRRGKMVCALYNHGPVIKPPNTGTDSPDVVLQVRAEAR